jgi:hypothetical protein
MQPGRREPMLGDRYAHENCAWTKRILLVDLAIALSKKSRRLSSNDTFFEKSNIRAAQLQRAAVRYCLSKISD